MTDPRVKKLARLLVDYCIAVRPGDRIVLNGNSAALPLVIETYREVIRAGGYPFLNWSEEQLTEILLKEANEEQLQHIPRPLELAYETYDGLISISGSHNTRALSGVDPQRQQIRQGATRHLLHTMMQRSAADELRWVTTLFPTNAHAQEADMSLSEFESFVYGSCHVDKDDPVAVWTEIAAVQQQLVDWLKGKKEVRVTGPDVDLTLSIENRTFINADGRKNMPSGEIFTGPVETSVNGWVRFTYPALYSGREVEGVELRFKNGRVEEACAKKNEAFLLSILDADPGARYLGEFAIGTNHGIDRFTKAILFDEKIGGTIHLAVGAGYPETGSKNESAVHWDMICDMRNGGQIWVDGELFYESGRFTVLEQALPGAA